MENTKISRTEPARLARIMLHPIALAVHFVFIMLINRLVWKEGPFSADGFLYGGWLGSFAFALIMTAFCYFSGYFFAAWRERGATWRALLSCVGAFCYTFSFTRFLMYGFFTSEFLHETWFDFTFWVCVLSAVLLYMALYFSNKYFGREDQHVALRPMAFIVHFFFMMLWGGGFVAAQSLDGKWLHTLGFALATTFFFYIYNYFHMKWKRGGKLSAFLIGYVGVFFWLLFFLKPGYLFFFPHDFLHQNALTYYVLIVMSVIAIVEYIYVTYSLSDKTEDHSSR